MEGNHISSPNIWRKILLIYLSNAIMVIPLNPAIDRTRNAQNIMCPRYKEPRWVSLLFFLLLQAVQNCSRLHKWTNIIDMNYARLVSKPSQLELHPNSTMTFKIHSKILSTLLKVFVRHTFDSCRKAFMKFIIKWMYFQISCNFVFLINTLQDTTTELGSRQFIVDVELPF